MGPLRAAALRAYARDPAGAAPWYRLQQWAELFAKPKARAVQEWIAAVEAAHVGHANMERAYALPPGSLASLVPAPLQTWLLGQAAFSEEFFATLDPLDDPVATLGILARIHAAQPALFAEQPRLALALAVVCDVPPPPGWPHGQVSAAALPRRWPDPVEAFTQWVRLDRANPPAQRLRRLPAAELKFVIDTTAPFAELAWAQRHVTPPVPELDRAYGMIRYRTDRLEQGRFHWPLDDYRLETILREGGICVDQAYFAANAGKARGVPTLFFRGAGLDGRHAWFGYLAPQGWKLDAGRYAEQFYVTGTAYDPQTWRDLTDHELKFLAERFRATPLYRLAGLHAAFARERLREGDHAGALGAAREGVNRERRHLEAWATLLAVQAAAGTPAREREGTLREAMLAFQAYPDLEAAFSRQLTAHLRAHGEGSLADHEEQRLARKYQAGRSDLSIQQAAAMLLRSIEHDDPARRVQTYQQILRTYGQGAGIDFYDRVVRPFVEHLTREGRLPAAVQALELAGRTLRAEPGSQLEQEMKTAAAALRPQR